MGTGTVAFSGYQKCQSAYRARMGLNGHERPRCTKADLVLPRESWNESHRTHNNSYVRLAGCVEPYPEGLREDDRTFGVWRVACAMLVEADFWEESDFTVWWTASASLGSEAG